MDQISRGEKISLKRQVLKAGLYYAKTGESLYTI